MMRERYAALSGLERITMAASMFDSARAIARANVGDDPLALLDRLYPELKHDQALRARLAQEKT